MDEENDGNSAGGQHGVSKQGFHGCKHQLEDVADMFHVTVWIRSSTVLTVPVVAVPIVVPMVVPVFRVPPVSRRKGSLLMLLGLFMGTTFLPCLMLGILRWLLI